MHSILNKKTFYRSCIIKSNNKGATFQNHSLREDKIYYMRLITKCCKREMKINNKLIESKEKKIHAKHIHSSSSSKNKSILIMCLINLLVI